MDSEIQGGCTGSGDIVTVWSGVDMSGGDGVGRENMVMVWVVRTWRRCWSDEDMVMVWVMRTW